MWCVWRVAGCDGGAFERVANGAGGESLGVMAAPLLRNFKSPDGVPWLPGMPL